MEALLAERRWLEELARRLVRDPDAAADVAQQAWVKVLARRTTPVRNLRAWLASVVRSCAVDRARSESRRRSREDAVPPRAPEPTADDLLARAEAQRAVLDALLTLDPPSRTVVLLRYFENLEPVEIARRTGEPAGTVRSRLHRALATLRRRLDAAHGGDRAAWGVALVGAAEWNAATALPGSAAAAATATVPTSAVPWKGVVLMTTNAKVATGAAAALLLALFLWGTADGNGETPPSAPPPREVAAEGGRVAGEDVHAEPDARPEPPPAAEPTGDEAAIAALPGEGKPAGPRLLPFTVLPARGGPEPEPEPDPEPDDPDREPRVFRAEDLKGEVRLAPAGGPGVGGMTIEPGGSKWAPIPEKGTVTLRGRVVDRTGRPLPGAVVHRIEPEAGGMDGDIVSFRHIHEIATTGDDGRFEALRQPARAVRLVADYARAMVRPRGLLFHDLVPIDPAENAVVADIVLAVPVDRDAFGTISGIVIDEEGAPLGNIRVFAGYAEGRSGKDGRFRMDTVPAGDSALLVEEFGWKTVKRTVTVRPGATTELEVRLELAVTGDLVVSGVVRDRQGNPVPDVPLWCGGGPFGFARETASDGNGAFRFTRIPRSLDGKKVVVSVMTDPDEAGIIPATTTGITVPSGDVVITVDRSVKLVVHLTDAADGTPLVQYAVEVEKKRLVDGAETWTPNHMASHYDEEGVFTTTVVPGPLRLFLKAPDHAPLYIEVDVPGDEPGPFAMNVGLYR